MQFATTRRFINATLLVGGIAACVSRSDEIALRQRLDLYTQLIVQHRYWDVWPLMFDRLPAGNDDDPNEFSEYWRKSEIVVIHMETQAIRIDGDVATVRVSVTARSGGETGNEVDEQSWIKENGRWFFDDWKTIE
jgi:hypothetical protein